MIIDGDEFSRFKCGVCSGIIIFILLKEVFEVY